jgi:CDP-glycerol glycerophosphotransferase (TagB/SpsB family)
MVRELLIGLYLFFFKIQFNLFKLFPIKDKVVFVVSFSQNSLFVYRELQRQNVSSKAVFLCKSCYPYIKEEAKDSIVLPFETLDVWSMIKSIYHLATARTIIVDNYYGFLAAISFKEEVQCIQLWHAAGAIKTFGLKDHSVKGRSKKAKKRFQKVYSKFHKVVVGSDALANIFMEAFGLPSSRILRTGIPRTDLFFDKELQKTIISKLLDENKTLENKKIILYAPTYRDNELNDFEIKLDLDLMQKELGEEFVLIIRLHPAIKKRKDYEKLYPGFVFDYSYYPDINHLLLITDLLITDYSSIPYEFALLTRPMIFFPYDLEHYKTQRGIWEDYNKMVPGPVVYTTEEILSLIKENKFDLSKIREFAKEWNRYSNGRSSLNLVHYLYSREEYQKATHGY